MIKWIKSGKEFPQIWSDLSLGQGDNISFAFKFSVIIENDSFRHIKEEERKHQVRLISE
jgi:hypothetical protein